MNALLLDTPVQRAMGHLLPFLRRLPWLLPCVTYAIADVTLGRRRGLVRANQQSCLQLRNCVKPFDILLTKSRFKLTDRLIPGYFNHAAIYLGSEAAHLDQRSDRSSTWPSEDEPVLEAVRSGVRVTTFEDCINADTVAVLRDDTLQDVRRQHIVQRAILEFGKGYDSWFESDSGERQFCSKLVGGLFSHLPLAAAARVPGFVLPDDFACLALGSPPALTLAQLVVDGVVIADDQRIACCASRLAGC